MKDNIQCWLADTSTL